MRKDHMDKIKVVAKVSDPPALSACDLAQIQQESQRLHDTFAARTAHMEILTAHDLIGRRLAKEEWPYVCPGCYAVAPERCLPGCIDAEIEEDHRRAIESGDYDCFNNGDEDEEDEP